MDTVYYVVISMAVLAMVAGLFVIIMILLKNKKEKQPLSDRFKYSVGAYLCILVSYVNWYFNMGDIRSILMIPGVIYTVIFFVATWFSSAYVMGLEALERATTMGIATFLLSNLLLPDFSAEASNNAYFMFFNLIHSDQIATVCMMLSVIALIVNIVMIVRQLYLAFKIR